MGETLHIAYKKYKIKKKIYFFLVNIKYISSSVLKTRVRSTRENSEVFNKLDEYIFGIQLKKLNILYI